MSNIQNLIEENLAADTVIAVNISYFPDTENSSNKKENFNKKNKFTYDYFTTTIPVNILKYKDNPELYFDVLEAYVYNKISHQSQRQVAHCQIFIND